MTLLNAGPVAHHTQHSDPRPTIHKDDGTKGHGPSLSEIEGFRVLTVSAWLTGVYFVIEMAIGAYTGSIAVISEAFHTFSAVGGVVFAIVAAHIALRGHPKNDDGQCKPHQTLSEHWLTPSPNVQWENTKPLPGRKIDGRQE